MHCTFINIQKNQANQIRNIARRFSRSFFEYSVKITFIRKSFLLNPKLRVKKLFLIKGLKTYDKFWDQGSASTDEYKINFQIYVWDSTIDYIVILIPPSVKKEA